MSRSLTPFVVALALWAPCARAAAPDPLASGFADPPQSAAPRTWWHWVDGNVSQEGITLDLEAMKQAGIGGATMFNVSLGIPRGPVSFLSDRWRQLTAFATKEAARLGLDLGIHNCAGWSSSGGPWITPEHSMQVIAWSETRVRGPRAFYEGLPPIKALRRYEQVPYSRDIAVFAFRTPPIRREALPHDDRFLAATGVIRKNDFDPDPSLQPLTPPIRRFVNLTSALDSDGRLTWYVPQGDWTILRIGHVTNGKYNHVPPAEGEGLEVDKLSREAVTAHWEGMMALVIADAGPLAGKTLDEVLIDSYEVGSQNWTPRFREEFRKRRGYDCFPWLPALTGIVVESEEKSARFLWDYRRTIADLYAENYYGTFAALARKAGMKFAAEAYGNGGFDDVEAAGRADVPMGEFGAHGQGPIESVKLAASAGHVYGKPVIAAESFTTGDARDGWSLDPYSVKAVGDRMFCQGVNRCVFHTYAHQPWRALVPGMTMGRFGMQLGRTLTWWKDAAAWIKYLTRCQYLLQKGQPVADILYFRGEGAPPITRALAFPSGYDYDFCDSIVLKRLGVKNGRLVLPNGASYRVLVLPNSRFMTPEVARKIRDLVAAGAIVVGPKPDRSPSLSRYPFCDDEVRRVAGEAWRKVISDEPLDRVLAEAGVPPDFKITSGASIAYTHRRIGDAEVYFVSNQAYAPAQIDAAFRVAGRAPELWHPDSGRIEPAAVFREEKGVTVVPLRLGPAESQFVVFRRPAPKLHWTDVRGPLSEVALASDGSLVVTPWERGTFVGTLSTGSQRHAEVPTLDKPIALNGPWKMTFEPNRGAPPAVTLPALISWTAHPTPGVRYFSGTATYTADFDFPTRAPALVVLSLGTVKNFARVTLNRVELPPLWKEPFAVDISSAVRPGRNHLSVDVTNLWPNRLIGDEQLPPDAEWEGTALKAWPAWLQRGTERPKTGRVTFTTWRFYRKSSALLESGLLGPVTIRTAAPIRLSP